MAVVVEWLVVMLMMVLGGCTSNVCVWGLKWWWWCFGEIVAELV